MFSAPLCPVLRLTAWHNVAPVTGDPPVPFACFFPSPPGILFHALPPAVRTQQNFHERFTSP